MIRTASGQLGGHSADTVIGRSVTVGHQASLHGCTIGDRALIGMNATLLEGSQVGCCWLLLGAGGWDGSHTACLPAASPCWLLGCHKHQAANQRCSAHHCTPPILHASSSPPLPTRPPATACLQVEEGAMVAAGAVVAPGTVVRSGEIWGGNPAVFLRKLKPEESKFLGESAEHYARLAAEHAEETGKPLEQVAAEKGLAA